MSRNIQQWMIIVNINHPKLDNFISDEKIIHFWMILYGYFHPFLDQEHTSTLDNATYAMSALNTLSDRSTIAQSKDRP